MKDAKDVRRFFHLAKELGLTNNELLGVCKKYSVKVKHHAEQLTPELEVQILEMLEKNKQEPVATDTTNLFPLFGVVKFYDQWGIAEYSVDSNNMHDVKLVKFHTDGIKQKANAVIRLEGFIDRSRIKKREE